MLKFFDKYILFILIFMVILYMNINHIEYFTETYEKPHIYVINLKQSIDRWQDITKQMDRNLINYTRIEAINGNDVDRKSLIDSKILYNKTKIANGELGCYLSHMNILHQNINSSNFIVMEDDVIITPNFWNNFNKYMTQLPNDWDILYLGASNMHCTKITKNIMKPTVDKITTANTGTYAMLYRTTSIKKILNHLLPIKIAIDLQFKSIRQNHNLKAYYCYPPLILHNNKYESLRRKISNKGPIEWYNKVQNKITIY